MAGARGGSWDGFMGRGERNFEHHAHNQESSLGGHLENNRIS